MQPWGESDERAGRLARRVPLALDWQVVVAATLRLIALAFRLLQSIVLTAPSLVSWTGSKTGQMTQPATCIVFCITGGL